MSVYQGDVTVLQQEFICAGRTSPASPRRLASLLQRCLLLQAAGRDTAPLVPHVAPLAGAPGGDLRLKKAAYTFLGGHHGNQELSLLATNTFVRDCTDANPLVRGLALRAVTQQGSEFTDMLPLLMRGLSDDNPYVRRVAVIGCQKVHARHPEMASSFELLDKLYSLIRDSDPVVTSSALTGLESMLTAEGGVALNQNLAYFLLNNVARYTTWGLAGGVMQVLKKFVPASEEDVFMILNILDGHLHSNSPAVVTSVLDYVLHITQNIPNLTLDDPDGDDSASVTQEVVRLATNQLVHTLVSGHKELNYAVLSHLSSHLSSPVRVAALRPHLHHLAVSHGDVPHAQLAKVNIISRLTHTSNHRDVLSELETVSLAGLGAVSVAAVHALGHVASVEATHDGALRHSAINVLVGVAGRCSRDVKQVLPQVFQVLQQFDLQQKFVQAEEETTTEMESTLQHLVNLVMVSFEEIDDVDGKTAMLWLLGEYGVCNKQLPGLMDKWVDELDVNTDDDILIETLVCTSKLFMQEPAMFQETLSRILEKCANHPKVRVSEQARYYYRLLDAGHGHIMTDKGPL